MTLQELIAFKDQSPKPKVVCLCGSIRRAARAFDEYDLSETVAGNIVLMTKASDAELFHNKELEEIKQQLDVLHFYKIDLADEVIILNKDGYIGESTRREIQYAQLLGKPIRWIEEPTNLT